MKFEEVLQILDEVVFAKNQRYLKDVEKFVLLSAWQGQTYEEMARASNYQYTPNYLKHCVGPRFWRLISEALEEDICKTNFRAALERLVQLKEDCQARKYAAKQLESEYDRATTKSTQDWGEAVEVFAFYGRQAELALLEQWISTQRCRLILLHGMGGMGKTALAVKLVKQIQDEFDYLIWRSLRNAPSIMAILSDLLAFLCQQEEADLPDTLDGRLLRLMYYLRSHRCLLVLDNIESILQSGDHLGCYAESYEGYGQLFQNVAEMPHQSCLLLTSREQPKGFAALEGETLPIHSLRLMGLPLGEGKKIFHQKGSYFGLESEWESVILHYAGNPLALKVVATAIQDLFESRLAGFIELLKQGTFVFSDIGDLLERQFNRLSDLEQEVMYWLSINREPCSITQLQDDVISPVLQQELPNILQSLSRRSLIEKSAAGYTQKPAIMEFVTDRLIKLICTEITTGKINVLNSHILLKAQTKDYIRDVQLCLILHPIIKRASAELKGRNRCVSQLNYILSRLRVESRGESGYGGGNILNLLCQLQADLTGYDFSYLTIRQAYLPDVRLPAVNFAGADLTKSVFAEAMNTTFTQRLYEGMNITGVTGLTADQKATLTALGAVEIDTDESCQMAHSWTVAIASYLKDYNQVTIKQVLAHTQPDISNCSKADQMKVSRILRSLGWKKSPQKKRINGISTCYWFRPVLTPHT